jgi:hypothetical protein
MANPWFRMYASFATDPRVQMLSEVDQRRLVMLYCSHHKGDRLSDEHRAFAWRITPLELLATKGIFMDRGIIDEEWNVVGWKEIQHPSDERPAAHIWAVIRKRIFERDNYTCQYCGRGGRLECDHIIPVSRGGSHDDNNLATACKPCNQSKKAKLLSEWSGV